MPYDDNLARIKAEMMMQNRPLYDDGASELESGPGMMQVGLFGRGPKPTKPVAPPVDMQRRSILGLKPQAEYPVPAIRATDIPVPTSNFPTPAPQQAPMPAPTQPTPAQPVSPLNDLANKALNAPMSRRDVLQRAGQAALQQAIPMPSITGVVPAIASPLTEAVTTTAATAASGMSPAIASALRNLLKERIGDVMEYGEDEVPITVEKYLGYAPDFDPALKKDITRELKEYNDLTQEKGQYLERYDDIRDREYELAEYLEPLVDRMPGDKAWQELTSHMEFDDYLNEHGELGLAKQFRNAGATKQEVIDFLDTYYMGFDPDDRNFARGLDKLYAGWGMHRAPEPAQSLADKTLNAPISRREVLKKTGQAALQQVLPTPSISDIAPQVVSPLAAAAQNTPYNTFVPNPGVDEYMQDYISNMFSDMEASEPFAATTSTYTFVRDYLDGRVPQKELNKFDKLKNRVDKYYDNDDEYSDKATTAQESLANFIQEKLKLLKPHELYDVNENLSQETLSPEEFYNYILESRGGEGLESFGAEGFTKYLEASEKATKLVVPEAPAPKPKPQTMRLESVFEHPDQTQAFESWAIGQRKAGVEGGDALYDKAISLANALRLGENNTDPKMLNMRRNRGMALASTLRGLNRNDEANQVESWALNKGK